jgi:hypothetical protein
VKRWLQSRANPPARYPDVAGLIAQWITRGRWDNLQVLCREAWSQANIDAWDLQR